MTRRSFNEILDASIQDDLTHVNSIIMDTLKNAHTPMVETLGTYIIESGGKRLRPVLTLLFAHMAKQNKDNLARAYKAAAAV